MDAPQVDGGYLEQVFKPKEFKSVIDKATKSLINYNKQVPFDAIAFCGVSGAALAFPISYLTGKHLICVRKEFSHDERDVVGLTNAERYVIVDDQIASGDTIKRITKTIHKHSPQAKLVGVYIFGFVEAEWRKKNKNIKLFNWCK